MSENRKRAETLTVRVTKTEKAAIVSQAKKAGMNLTEYILALARQLPIHPPPDLSPLLVELKRIGNNINQIAARVNSGAAYVPDLRQITEQQKKLYDQLLRLAEDEKWRP